MSDSEPIPAKMTRPRTTNALVRTRLFDILDQSRAKMIWIMGPPGSGKTTLIASYLSHRKFRSIWYRIDRSDSDVATLFYYLRQAAPQRGTPLPLLTAEYLLSLPTFSRNYFRRLFEKLKSPSILVFDNHQDIEAGSAFNSILREGLEEIPENSRAILISREEPPKEFARFRANQEMAVIGWEELQLTTEETASLVELQSREKGDKDPMQLQQKAGGWAAGVVLLLESMNRTSSQRIPPQEASSETVFGYFASEIFDRAEPVIQEILLQTAFFPQMTIKMAELLTGHPEAGRLLSKLVHSHYFIARHGTGAETIYRYHDLFRTFLLEKAQEKFEPADIKNIQERTASILEQHGEIEAAVALYHSAGKIDEMVRLTLAHAPHLGAQGRSNTLLGWFHRLPTPVIDKNPWLIYWLGICQLPFNPAQSRRDFERAFRLFHENHDRVGIWLSWSKIVETFIHEGENMTELDRWIALMEGTLLKEEIPFPTSQIEARSVYSMFCALMLKQPDHPDILTWKEKAFSMMQMEQDLNLRLQIGSYLVFHSLWIGDFSAASRVVEMLRQAILGSEVSPLMQIIAKFAEAMVAWRAGNFAACLNLTIEGLRLAQESGVHLWDCHLLCHGIASALSLNDQNRAEAMLRQMEAGLPRMRRIGRLYYHHLACWMALQKGDLSSSYDHAKLAAGLSFELKVPYLEAISRACLAEVYLQRESYEQADHEIAEARRIGLGMKSRQIEFMYLIFDAALQLQQGLHPNSLRKALALGREHRIFTMFGWRLPIIAQLCSIALDLQMEIPYVQELIRKRKLSPPSSTVSPLWPWPIKVFTLGRFAILIEDRPIQSSGKSQKKPLELLKALAASGGSVSEEFLAEALWPHTEADAALVSLKTTLHRLRRLLGRDDAVLHQEGALRLNSKLCWVDLWEFKDLVKSANFILKQPAKNGKREGSNPSFIKIHDRILSLYQGHFLDWETKTTWTVSPREQLKEIFLAHLTQIGRCWEEAHRWEEAIHCYSHGLEIDSLAEPLYQHLMNCYLQLNRRAEALAIYQRCSNLLSAVLGISPSPQTEEIYQKLFSPARSIPV